MRREALRLSFRAVVLRPAESLLLILNVALAVVAASAGITLAGAGAAISERLLASLRFREIVVSVGIDRRHKARDMKLPARPKLPSSVILAAEDLHGARSVSPAVRYAYLTDERSWEITNLASEPRPQRRHLSGMVVTPDYFAARDLTPSAGRLFTEAEAAGGKPVMVLGSWLGATLFEDGAAVGRTIWSDGQQYRIVGVLAPNRNSPNSSAFAPFGVAAETAVVMLHFDDRRLQFTVADRRSLAAANEQLTQYFDAVYGPGVLHVSDPSAEARLIAGRFRGVVRAVLVLSVSVLTVAALYLANIFAGRALRKRRSAGILRAVGATAGGVFAVFAVEGAVIAAIGAAAGLGVAALLAGDISYRIGVEVSATGPILAGLGLALTIVAACSLLPAAAVARAPAAEAIRYE